MPVLGLESLSLAREFPVSANGCVLCIVTIVLRNYWFVCTEFSNEGGNPFMKAVSRLHTREFWSMMSDILLCLMPTENENVGCFLPPQAISGHSADTVTWTKKPWYIGLSGPSPARPQPPHSDTQLWTPAWPGESCGTIPSGHISKPV